MNQITINNITKNVIIIAHNEDTERLEAAFRAEGLAPKTLRRPYSNKEKCYSQSIRVLLSHIEAWRLCEHYQEPTIICEADFVPCRGFGTFPVPLPLEIKGETFIAWLYACGPTIYHLEKINSLEYARGHCAAPVALLLTSAVAARLHLFGHAELKTSNPYLYSTWDTRMSSFLKHEGISSYISVRNYGEHGGLPNAEHRVCGNLRAAHRADSLMSSLHYLPFYARGSKIRFYAIRLKAKFYGLMRVLFFRLIRLQTLLTTKGRERFALMHFAAARILCKF